MDEAVANGQPDFVTPGENPAAADLPPTIEQDRDLPGAEQPDADLEATEPDNAG